MQAKKIHRILEGKKYFDSFLAFHEENPEVLDLFITFSKLARKRRKSYGAKSIAEQIRWHVNIERGNDSFKLNNTFTAYYARLVLESNKKLFKDFFKTRKSPNTTTKGIAA